MEKKYFRTSKDIFMNLEISVAEIVVVVPCFFVKNNLYLLSKEATNGKRNCLNIVQIMDVCTV